MGYLAIKRYAHCCCKTGFHSFLEQQKVLFSQRNTIYVVKRFILQINYLDGIVHRVV